jgi:hypothetical protein
MDQGRRARPKLRRHRPAGRQGRSAHPPSCAASLRVAADRHGDYRRHRPGQALCYDTGQQAAIFMGGARTAVRVMTPWPHRRLEPSQAAGAPRQAGFLLAHGRSPSPQSPLQLRITYISPLHHAPAHGPIWRRGLSRSCCAKNAMDGAEAEARAAVILDHLPPVTGESPLAWR